MMEFLLVENVLLDGDDHGKNYGGEVGKVWEIRSRGAHYAMPARFCDSDLPELRGGLVLKTEISLCLKKSYERVAPQGGVIP